jgi:hypothetical protein
MATVVRTCSRAPVSDKLRMVQSTLNEPPAKTIFPLLSTRWAQVTALVVHVLERKLERSGSDASTDKERAVRRGTHRSQCMPREGGPGFLRRTGGRVRPVRPNERKTDVMSSAISPSQCEYLERYVGGGRGGGGSGNGSGNGGLRDWRAGEGRTLRGRLFIWISRQRRIQASAREARPVLAAPERRVDRGGALVMEGDRVSASFGSVDM